MKKEIIIKKTKSILEGILQLVMIYAMLFSFTNATVLEFKGSTLNYYVSPESADNNELLLMDHLLIYTRVVNNNGLKSDPNKIDSIMGYIKNKASTSNIQESKQNEN